MNPRDDVQKSGWEVATEGLFDQAIPNPFEGSIYTPTPQDVALDHHVDQFFNEEVPKVKEHPDVSPPKPDPLPTGTYRTAKEEFKRASEFGSLSRGMDIDNNIPNPRDMPYDPNWNPNSDPANVYGVSDVNKPWVLAADNAFEQRRRQQLALEWQERDKLIDNGTWLGYLAGGAIGITIGSPSNMIPITAGLRMTKASYTAAKSAVRALPGLTIGAVMHETIEEQGKVQHNLADYVTNVFADMIFAGAIVGGFGYVGHKLWESKLFESRKLLAIFGRGAELKPVVNAKGEITDTKVFDVNNNLSAAEVDFAQKLVDSTMSKSGIFSVPYLGTATTKMMSLVSPGFRGLNSPFEAIRGYADRLWSHGLVTEGIEKGEAAPVKFDDLVSRLRALNTQDFDWLRGLHAEMNGVEMSKLAPVAAAQKLAMTYKEKKLPANYTTMGEFSRRIRNVLINEEQDSATQVNEAASRYRKVTDDLLADFQAAYNLPDNFIHPKTARGYFMRVYDLEWMRGNENTWMDVMTGWLRDTDEAIGNRMKPVKDLETTLATAKEVHQNLIFDKSSTQDMIKASDENVNFIKQQLSNEHHQLQNELRSNPDYHVLTDDINALSGDEAQKVKQIRKPIDDVNQEMNVITPQINKAKEAVDTAEKAILKHQKVIKKAKHDETRIKNEGLRDEAIADHTESKAQLEALEAQHRTLEGKVYDLEQKLYEDMANSKIDPWLYYKDASDGKFKLKDHNNRLKFRDTFESDLHRSADARASYLSVINETADDIVHQVMNSLTGNPSPDMLKRRSLMVPDHILHDNQMLSSNIASNLAQYRMVMGKKIAMKAAFKDTTINGGLDEMVLHVDKEYRKISDKINERERSVDEKISKETNPEKKVELETQKKDIRDERKKWQKNFQEGKDWMASAYDKMMGRTWFSEKAGKPSRKVARGLLAFTAAARLGWVPFTQLADLTALIFKHGLGSFVIDGLLPAFENMNGFRGTAKGLAFKENAGHIAVGFQHTFDNYHDKNLMGQAQEYLPGMQWYSGDNLLRGVEWVSHSVGNFTGANYVDNFMQRVTANIMQSKVIRLMQKQLDGTISKKETTSLLLYGLDPKEWAERFVNGWKEVGEHGNGFGGFISYYYRWTDTEASSKMADTLFRGVRDSVYTRRGMLDAPFWVDGGTGVFMSQFKGYLFSSVTRYLLPTLQRPDAEKMIGTMFMIAAGGAQYNLRKIAHGNDPETDPEKLLFHSLEEAGGLTVAPMWALEAANTMSNGTLLKDFQNPRFANISKLGMSGGPAMGVFQGGMRLLNMIGSGEINQVGLKQASHMIPYLSAWELQMFNDKMIEGLNIPQSPQQARARARSAL